MIMIILKAIKNMPVYQYVWGTALEVLQCSYHSMYHVTVV